MHLMEGGYSEEESAEQVGLSVKDAREWGMMLTVPVASLEATTLEGDELHNMIPSEKRTFDFYGEKTPEEEVLGKKYKEYFWKLVDSNLSEKEAYIVKWRFGFYGRCKSLKELGKEYGRSKERIRQIENKALGKLKKSEVLESLRDPCLLG